jgi:transcriptional regulator with XRE-family HTH domain
MTADTFAARLQALRRGAGLSQSQLARRAGLSVRTLQGWEAGRRVPSVEAAALLAAALGISLDRLAGLKGAPQ